MPRAKIKSLEEVDPIISKAFKEAFSNPGKEILVAPHLAEDVAINLQVKMKAVRQGFRIYFHEDHEYHRVRSTKESGPSVSLARRTQGRVT